MSARAPVHAQVAAQEPPRVVDTPSRRCACGGVTDARGECATCRAKRTMLQRRAIGPAPSNLPPVVRDLAALPGRPLEPETRHFMEGRFGHDFGHVRVHADGRAATATRAVNALAYTLGPAIAFGPGAYAPRTDSGRRLLAHELTHVVQQGRGGAGDGAALEAEAARAGDAAAAGRSVVVAGAAPAVVQRQGDPAREEPLPAEPEDDKFVKAWVIPPPPIFTMPTAEKARELLGQLAGEDVVAVSTASLHGVLGQKAYWSFRHPVHGEIGRVVGTYGNDTDASGRSASTFSLSYLFVPIAGAGKKPAKPGAGGGAAKAEQSQPGSGTVAGAVAYDKEIAVQPLFPVRVDLDALKTPALAEFYLLMLEHYTGRAIAPEDKTAATDGLTPEEISALIAGFPLRRQITNLLTQGYYEFQESAGTDIEQFKLLIQVIADQYIRGNPNAVRNFLRIGFGRGATEVDGIHNRQNSDLYYDRNGIPLPGLTGIGFRDKGYVGSRNKEQVDADIMAIEDPGVRGLLNALRQTVTDPNRMAYEGAQIYFENVERVNAEVLSGLSQEVLKKFEEMIYPFVGFLAGHAFSAFLMRIPNLQVQAMGLALKGMLVAAGYIFDIHFAGETMHRLFQAAAELVKVEKNEKGEFTRLSEVHIKNAAVPLRQMVADIAVMGAMHALGGMLRLAAKGLKRLKLECTHCTLDDIIAKEGEKQPENVPPEQPPVRAEDSPRGFAIEDAHVPQAGYRSLSEAGSVKAIDGIKGGDFDVVIENGQAVRVYTRPDGLSVKSTRVTDAIPLAVNITNNYLPPLRGRYSYKGGGIRINGLRNRRLDLLFEEGAHLNFTKETLRVLAEARGEAGSIEFNWYVYIQGRKVSGPEFLRNFSHLVTE